MTISVSLIPAYAIRVQLLRNTYRKTVGTEFPLNDFFIYGMFQHVGAKACEQAENDDVLVMMNEAVLQWGRP